MPRAAAIPTPTTRWISAARHATEVFTRMGFAAELAPAPEPATPPAGKAIPQRERIIGCTPAPSGIWRDRTPKWGAAYIWACCRAWSGPTQSLAETIERLEARRYPHTSMPFVEPELCLARLVAD